MFSWFANINRHKWKSSGFSLSIIKILLKIVYNFLSSNVNLKEKTFFFPKKSNKDYFINRHLLTGLKPYQFRVITEI